MSFAFCDDFDLLRGADGISLRIREKHPGGGAILPFYYYDILWNGAPAGKISIRIGDNYHSYFNGHVGYEVDAPYRGHRLSLRALRLVLPVARRHGMTRLYLTCREDNAASRAILEAAGARFLEAVPLPPDYFAWQPGVIQRIYELQL